MQILGFYLYDSFLDLGFWALIRLDSIQNQVFLIVLCEI